MSKGRSPWFRSVISIGNQIWQWPTVRTYPVSWWSRNQF